jgi:Sec-independent protein translocase protein TatA
MEILGIGPGEFILILIVLLVVVGPERLPGLARQIGQFLVRARNWLQTSPDAALVMRARAELEAELASIKNSLLEVQVVRDEVLGAARQFEDSVNSITPPKVDLNSLVNPPAEPTIAANGQAPLAGETLAPSPADSTASIPLDQRSTLELPQAGSVPAQPPAEAQPADGLNGQAYGRPEEAIAASPAPALAELESINIRLQAIMADMWALQQQLKQRGALDEAWQPPSLDVQLPAPEAAAPVAPLIEPPGPAEPVEDEVVLATSEADTQIDPVEQPAAKPRRRRAAATAEPSQETAETPANGVPAATPRRRRAAATADPSQETAETPANGAPVARTRKRRTPATSPSIPFDPAAPELVALRQAQEPGQARPRDPAEPSDETEPVTTEKAS